MPKMWQRNQKLEPIPDMPRSWGGSESCQRDYRLQRGKIMGYPQEILDFWKGLAIMALIVVPALLIAHFLSSEIGNVPVVYFVIGYYACGIVKYIENHD